jgi:hypothetical protein
MKPEKDIATTIAYIITGMYFVSGGIILMIYYLSSIDDIKTARDLAVTGLMSFALAPAMMIFGTVLVMKGFYPGVQGKILKDPESGKKKRGGIK